jgi:8-oxo-dGTP pyrophosphatase MutT (NUDIX family)
VSNNQYKHEENCSRDKFEILKKGVSCNSNTYTLASLIEESNLYAQWEDPEWGFPKGRRNFQERDYDCAVREFCEETGINKEYLTSIHNIYPYEEIYTGSNYKSYKHKYYLAYIPHEHSKNLTNFEITEVSKMEWKNYDECISAMRPYNLEKQRLLTNINNTLTQHKMSFI